MTLQNISRLASLIAKHFREIPAFDYRIYCERQAEGNEYPLGNYVLILRNQELGLAQFPEIFRIPGGYELRARGRRRQIQERPEDFRCVYRKLVDYEVIDNQEMKYYTIHTPSGETIYPQDLALRQKRFLREAHESGFAVARKLCTSRIYEEYAHLPQGSLFRAR